MATAPRSTPGADLLRMKPTQHPVVTCYLKIENRDRARKKYLTKLKNRIKAIESELATSTWTRAQQDVIRLDLARVFDRLRDVDSLPDTQGVAVFASAPRQLFEVHALPRVHRSRLVVDRTPLVRELAAAQEDFGRLLVVTFDRASALIWEVTSSEARVVRKVASEITRGRFHGSPGSGPTGKAGGEYTFHNRIRDEKRRHLESVARALFEVDRAAPGHYIVLAGAAKDAQLLEPFLHRYQAERLIGLARMAPRDATPDAVHQLALEVREAHRSASETHHSEELFEALGSGWGVNGLEDTLKALAQGQVRHLLVRGEAEAPGFRSLATGRLAVTARALRDDGDVIPTHDVIDDAIEEALRQRVSLDVVYQPEAAEAIHGLAALLRFK